MTFLIPETLACSWAEGLQRKNNVHVGAECSLHPLCALCHHYWSSGAWSVMRAHRKGDTWEWWACPPCHLWDAPECPGSSGFCGRPSTLGDTSGRTSNESTQTLNPGQPWGLTFLQPLCSLVPHPSYDMGLGKSHLQLGLWWTGPWSLVPTPS